MTREEEILAKLQALCVKREYCTYDITRKAKTLLKDEADADLLLGSLIESLMSDGFVDDMRYSRAYAREKSVFDGWGPLKIKSALLVKGIDRELIDRALQEVDEERGKAKLERVLAHKWKSLSSDPNGKLKLIRFALSRGYEYETIRPVVENIVSVSD